MYVAGSPYLIDVQQSTQQVEGRVQRVEHADDLEGRGCGAD